MRSSSLGVMFKRTFTIIGCSAEVEPKKEPGGSPGFARSCNSCESTCSHCLSRREGRCGSEEPEDLAYEEYLHRCSIKHWPMKTNAFLAVACPLLMWGQSDTLWAADIIGQVSKGSEYRTSADSLATDVESASDYLQKDSRFNLKQYTQAVSWLQALAVLQGRCRVLWDGIDS